MSYPVHFVGDPTYVTCLVIAPEELKRGHFVQTPTLKIVIAGSNVHGYRFDQIIVSELAYRHCYTDGDHGRQWLDDLHLRMKRPRDVIFL